MSPLWDFYTTYFDHIYCPIFPATLCSLFFKKMFFLIFQKSLQCIWVHLDYTHPEAFSPLVRMSSISAYFPARRFRKKAKSSVTNLLKTTLMCLFSRFSVSRPPFYSFVTFSLEEVSFTQQFHLSVSPVSRALLSLSLIFKASPLFNFTFGVLHVCRQMGACACVCTCIWPRMEVCRCERECVNTCLLCPEFDIGFLPQSLSIFFLSWDRVSH